MNVRSYVYFNFLLFSKTEHQSMFVHCFSHSCSRLIISIPLLHINTFTPMKIIIHYPYTPVQDFFSFFFAVLCCLHHWLYWQCWSRHVHTVVQENASGEMRRCLAIFQLYCKLKRAAYHFFLPKRPLTWLLRSTYFCKEKNASEKIDVSMFMYFYGPLYFSF